MDNQLDFHVPLYSNFLLGMMKAIQIQHNNEHDDEEFVLGPQCLEAKMIQLECRHCLLVTLEATTQSVISRQLERPSQF